MDSLQMLTKKAGQVMVKNSPSILTGVGAVGVVTTAMMAVRATPRAMLILTDERLTREETNKVAWGKEAHLTKMEIIKLTWKCYVPTIIMGGLTIGCIISANHINLRRNAALASVYGLTEAALKEYQSKVVETFGETKAQQVKDAIAKDRVENNPVKNSEVILTGNGETLCYDPFSSRYFRSDIEKVRKVQNELNRDLLNHDFVSLNDVYYALGLPETKLGADMGWVIDDGLIEFDFSSQLTPDGTPCLVLNFKDEPVYTHRDF